MDDRILHYRLQHQRGDRRFEQLRRHDLVDPQAITKAPLLNPQVAGNEIQLPLQGRLLQTGLGAAGAQNLGQVRNHVLGGQRVNPDQRRHGVQGIEQEMRLDLCT
jgi:hypothetical protein